MSFKVEWRSAKDFEMSRVQGKMTEDFVKKHIENFYGYKVKDVSEAKEGQDKDIDFIVHNEDNSICFALEVKNDNRIHQTGNFLIEYGHHRKTGYGRGGYFKCEATYLCFYDSIDNHGYFLDGQKIKNDIATKEWDKEQVFEFRKFGNKVDKCYSDAYFINVNKARERGYVLREF